MNTIQTCINVSDVYCSFKILKHFKMLSTENPLVLDVILFLSILCGIINESVNSWV